VAPPFHGAESPAESQTARGFRVPWIEGTFCLEVACLPCYHAAMGSPSTIRVLRVFLEQPDEPHWGHQLVKDARVSQGSIYGILNRLEDQGWLSARWQTTENLDTNDVKRLPGPPRRVYELTREGRQWAERAVEEDRHELERALASAQRSEESRKLRTSFRPAGA
jgi:PadR family transcriptional regulator, regulatory protein PadR